MAPPQTEAGGTPPGAEETRAGPTNRHQYLHVNYVTAEGTKGTIRTEQAPGDDSMELDEFKRAVSRLPKAEAREVRGRYIGTFVDMTRAECRQLADLSAAYPATTYWAYLWECLREPTVVDNRYALELADGLGEVLVFWDLHPDDRVLVQDYWKFERDDVLRLSYRLLLENLEHLPEDIYIFDRSFRWTLALTHEHVDQE